MGATPNNVRKNTKLGKSTFKKRGKRGKVVKKAKKRGKK